MAIWKSNKLGQAAPVLKHVLKRCSSGLGKTTKPHAYDGLPKGHFPVYVGESRSLYVVPISVLELPEFRRLLRLAEEEFGFCDGATGGGIAIPCEEDIFVSILATGIGC